MTVQYPEMRERLIGLLREANDPDADKRWLRGGWFDDWFNDLDSLVAEHPAESIGVVFTDEREAEPFAAFRGRLNAIYEDLGDAGYAAYRSDSRWAGVQKAARAAVAATELPSTPSG